MQNNKSERNFFIFVLSISNYMQPIFLFFRHNRLSIFRGLLFLLAIVLLVISFPKEGKFKYEFQKGRPWMHKDLIASYNFAILKPDSEIQQERTLIEASIKPYFNYNQGVTDLQIQRLSSLFESAWNDSYGGDPEVFNLKDINWQYCKTIFDTIADRGIIDITDDVINVGPENSLIIIKGNIAIEKTFQEVFNLQTAHDYIKLELPQTVGIDSVLLLSVLENSLFRNIHYDAEKTQEERTQALASISDTRGMVQSGERIISKGELVTQDKFMILESMRQEYQQQLGSSTSYYMILLGQIVLVSISLIVLFFFLMYFRTDIFRSNKRISLILLVVIMMVFITSLVIKYNVGYLYLVPICIIPIIIRAFFNTRPALYVHIITIILIGFLVPNSFEFVFSQLIAGIIAIISVVHLQKRAQFFLSSLMIFLTYSVVYIGLGLIQEGSISGLDWKYFLLFAGSAILTLFSYPLIYIFEKLFGLITDVTLIELSNTNSRLLRELSAKAPGTFQHSMQVANIAEEVLYEIGGDTLLARTGALYHDIGKMESPAYFTENQQSGINPHDRLSLDESASIIVNHIKRGVEIARKHNLPQQIIDFIRTHQGNRKTEYFYKMKLKEVGEEEIDKTLYTYPGPIPNSRETAVVMMADSLEAASRSLKEPDEASISNLVERIVDYLIESQQFINSNITFREITRIKEIIKKQLMNIYHVRIDYPK